MNTNPVAFKLFASQIPWLREIRLLGLVTVSLFLLGRLCRLKERSVDRVGNHGHGAVEDASNLG